MALCESEQAISTVQERNRDLLKSLAREQPQLYAERGQAFVTRREMLAARTTANKPPKRVRSAQRAKSEPAKREEVEHA